MDGLTFAWPLVLLWLLLLPLLALAYVLAQRRRRRYAVKFTNLDLLANVVSRSPGLKRHVPPVLILLALAALIVALARPETNVQVPRERASIMLATDSSGSMQATDVGPTRMAAAKSAAKDFAERLPRKFQLGLVSFDQSARLLSRPTTDRRQIQREIDALAPQGGTAMGDALDQSLRALRPVLGRRPNAAQNRKRPPAAIVLLSDGENTTGLRAPLDVARDARRLGVPISTIALGTDQGTVEVPDQSGFVQTISVPPDRASLRQIAKTTGGRYFDAPSADRLASIYDSLGSRIGFNRERREVAYVPAAFGVGLLLAGAALSLVWFGRIP